MGTAVTGMYADNDGRFPAGSSVLVRYPLTAEQEQDRDVWPWLPGTILGQYGPDEWHVVVDGVEELGDPDPDDPDELLYPLCFRDSSEIRRPAAPRIAGELLAEVRSLAAFVGKQIDAPTFDQRTMLQHVHGRLCEIAALVVSDSPSKEGQRS